MSRVYVYVIESFGGFHSKIGVSSAPEVRLATIQTGCPLDLHLAACYEAPTRECAIRAEREAHAALSEYRERGEWFSIPYDLCAGPIEAALYGEARQ